MSEISVSKCIGKGYNNGWFTNCKARYRCFKGGRSTKKSVDIGGYEPIFKILSNPRKNIIMCRRNDSDNPQSTYANLCATIIMLNLSKYFTCKVTPHEIIYKPTGQKIIFRGLNNPTGITSVKFAIGELTDIYFEEASELDSYEDFRIIDGTLRSQHEDLQITFMLNAWDKKSWIYEVFFKNRLEDDYDYLETHDYADFYDPNFNIGYGKGLYLHTSTFRINEFRSKDADESAAELKKQALEIYKVEKLGMWGNTSDSTYMYWSDSLKLPHHILMLEKYITYTIGIDFGMGNGEGKILKNDKDHPNRYRSATTMQLVGITQEWKKIITLDEYFYSNENKEIKKGSPEVAEDIINKILEWRDLYKSYDIIMKGTIICYVDSADSGGFRTLLEAKAKEFGLINIRFIASTKNKIQTRVDFENLMMAFGEFLVCDRCENLIREIRNAKQAEDGRCREDTDDHCINACEYAWIPLLPRIKRWKDFKER